MLDLQATLRSPDGKWTAGVLIQNATDEDWIAEEANPNGIVYYGKPRQYGIELGYRF